MNSAASWPLPYHLCSSLNTSCRSHGMGAPVCGCAWPLEQQKQVASSVPGKGATERYVGYHTQ